MAGLIADMGIGLLTSVVYDIVKYCGIKFSNIKKSKDKDLIALIETHISKNVPEDIRGVFDSAIFVSYFNSPQFIDLINAYIEHKILCHYSEQDNEIKKYINKSGIINYGDLVNYISINISERYSADMIAKIPDISLIKRSVLHIMTVAESITLQSISPENSRVLYFVNSRMDLFQENIIERLSRIQASINSIRERQLVFSNQSFDEHKDKYYRILKEKNSDAHIYLLDKFPFEKFYVPPVLRRKKRSYNDYSIYSLFFQDVKKFDGHFIAWKDIFVDNNIVYITGGAGYGKSLFMQKLINNYKDLNIFHSDEYLVIYGELKLFYSNGTDFPLPVVDFLKRSIENVTLMSVPDGFVEHYLNSGRCIILLDALDEVEKSKRDALHESVIAYFKSQNPNNKVCITSRERGFIPERDIEEFAICKLTEEQIEKYVDKIIALGKFERADKESFMKQSQVLIEKRFLSSFLVLSLLINIYKAERELPENKLELYQKCFEYIANKREQKITRKEFNWSVILPIMKDNTFIELSKLGMPNNSNIDKESIKDCLLQVYKRKFACEADTENAIEEFLKFCSDRTELFVPSSEDKFKFFHRSFFEYFYSLSIYRMKNAQSMLNELLKFDVDSEVFELTISMLKQNDEEKYQELIDLIFEKVSEEFNAENGFFNAFNALILSMQVIDDAYYKEKFVGIIIDQKDRILGNIDLIHNLRLIPNIFENDVNSCAIISDAYLDRCMMTILENCDIIFEGANRYEREFGESWTKELDFIKVKSVGERKMYIDTKLNADGSFYLNVFAKNYSCKDLLMNITDETLLDLYRKFSHRNYKKRTARSRENINKFKSLTNEQQDFLAKRFLSTDVKVFLQGYVY